jgi:predicted RecB family nuclease
MIDDQLIGAFINCTHKAYLLLNNPKESIECDFRKLEQKLQFNIKELYFNKIATNIVQNIEIQNIKPSNQPQILSNPFFKNDEFFLQFTGILQNKSQSTPLSISIFENPTKEEKIIETFKALVIKTFLKIEISELTFIRSTSLKISKVKIAPFAKEFRGILKNIRELVEGQLITKPSNKAHCQICQFQSYCKKHLIEKEDLSLLSGIHPKDILKKQAKGIFSITQLAYTFSPKKKYYSKKKFLPELKALAFRDKKTYIVKPPEFKRKGIEVFLDIEGIPDSKSYYLIGAIVKKESEVQSFSFWKGNDTTDIFQNFLDLISTFEDFTIYHYGTYEVTAFKAQKISFEGTQYEIILEKVIQNCVNILNEFLERVYPPTLTNSLKDISFFLGFEWKEPDINGYKSIYWRKYWEMTEDLSTKNKLINYNLEDCHALIIVKTWLNSLSNEDKFGEKIIDVSKIKKQSTFKFGDSGYIIPDFKEINSYAYFNYQRDKIYLKTNKQFFKISTNLKKSKKITPNKIINSIKPTKCIECESKVVYKNKHSNYRKLIDLKFGENSVKRHIIFQEQAQFRCRNCGKSFFDNYATDSPKYGWSLKIWCINQAIAYNLSLGNIVKSLKEQFDIEMVPNQILKFKTFLSEYYINAVYKIKNTVISGDLLQIDESQIEIKGIIGKSYVWVFTTIDSVFYLFKENREADFLIEMLKDFKGVLISDFYSGYDAIECSQQKCLVHLMRDLNDDLVKNPFNPEYQLIVNEFAILLKKITSTINIYGLKKRHLNKHKKEVMIFFDKIFVQKFETEIALFYQKKFKKYRGKLFTFLDYNGIPWNNNNAEVAIKPFAIHRNNLNALHTQKGIEEYLVLLSIQQTCKYRNLSFWEFLKSKKTEL